METIVPPRSPNDPCPCGSGRKYKKCHGGYGHGPYPGGVAGVPVPVSRPKKPSPLKAKAVADEAN